MALKRRLRLGGLVEEDSSGEKGVGARDSLGGSEPEVRGLVVLGGQAGRGVAEVEAGGAGGRSGRLSGPLSPVGAGSDSCLVGAQRRRRPPEVGPPVVIIIRRLMAHFSYLKSNFLKSADEGRPWS